MCIEWDKEFETGINCVDDQHKTFVGKINELEELIKNKSDQIDKDALIEDFIQYSEYHFKTEEKLMTKYNYPQLERHIARHDVYNMKVEEMKKKAGDDNFFNIKAFVFLKNWLITHILKEDQGYAKFLKKLNVPSDIEL